MTNRRKFLSMLTVGAVAFGLIAVPALADELLGVLTKVDVEAKKVTVVPKGSEDEVLVTVTDETEYVSKKGTSKLDLTKLSKNLERVKEKGRKGLNVKVEHKDAVASKIEAVFKKAEGTQN